MSEYYSECTLCGCFDCPHNQECQRKQQTVEFVPCPACGCFGKHRFCAIGYQAAIAEGEEMRKQNMDLKAHRSGKGDKQKGGKFEQREWIDSADLPKKGSAKWRIDAVRESKKKSKGLLAFMDVSNGKKKRVMSLRKGFTLDALMDTLGTKTEKWTGKTILLERGGDEGQYVNVAQ